MHCIRCTEVCKLATEFFLLCVVVSTVADVWSGGGGVLPQSLGSLLSTHPHSRDSSAAEATGHRLFLPP